MAINKEARAQNALSITYINIVLYALCYQLQRPVEPFLVEELSKTAGEDASSVTLRYGQLQSFFSTIQTIGSPIVGILLDRVGIRTASTAVFAASAASYAVLAVATDVDTLFYSKIPTALQHAFLVAQAVAAASCRGDEAARAQALGRMTTAYTIGATVGPYLGGIILARTDNLYIGAKLAVLGSLLSVLLSLLFLPSEVAPDREHHHHHENEKEHTTPPSSSRSFLQEVRNSLQIAARPNLWPLLTVKIISGVASSMHQTALPMVLTQQLHFDPAALGLSMSASMLASAAFGVIGLGSVTRWLGAMGMARGALLLRPALGALVAVMVSQRQLLGSYTPSVASSMLAAHRQTLVIAASVLHSLASHALATGVTTQTTGAVPPDEQGALLGLEHGLFSMARIGGPAAGTRLLTASGGGLGAVVAAGGAIDVSLWALLAGTASRVQQAGGRDCGKSKDP